MKKRMSFLSIIKELLTSKDQQGFSLAEVMVAAGMMGALSLVVVNLSKTANKTTKTISQTVEITEIHSTVLRALSIESACQETMTRSTSGGPALNVNDITGSPQPIINIYGKITQLGTFPVVITSDPTDNNADGKPDNEYGDQAGTINVQGIQVENYVQTGTSAAAGERYGSVDIRITYRKGHQSAALNDNIIKDGSFGGVNATKIIRGVQVVATTAGAVVSCRADSSQFLQAACDMFSGELLSSTVSSGFKCHNIKLFNTPDAGTGNINNKFSVIGRHDGANPNSEGSIKAEGGLVVGSGGPDAQFNTDTTAPGLGNALIQNALTVGPVGNYNATTQLGANSGNALVQGRMLIAGSNAIVPPAVGATSAAGDLFVARGLTVGPTMTAGNTAENPGDLVVQNNGLVQQDLTVSSDALVQNSFYVGPFPSAAFTDKVKIVGANLAASSALNVTNGSVTMANGATATNINTVKAAGTTVSLNSVAGMPIAAGSAANPEFNVKASGEIVLKSGASTVMDLATGTGAGYRPSHIYNMPAYTSGSFSGNEDKEIPTKRWVMQAVYNSLTDQLDLGNLMAAVSTIASQPFDAIMMAICDNIKVTTQVSVGAGSYSYGTPNCNINAQVCGDTAGARCATHYTTNYNATGTLSVSGVAAFGSNVSIAGNLTTNGSYIYASGGYIRAASYVRGDSYVYGGTYVQAGGGSPTGLSGICGAVGCATKFGRYACSGGGVVIGIANGHLVCAKVGGGASSPVGI